MFTLNDYNQAELEAATGAIELCRAHAEIYAPGDTDAAVIAALCEALQDEASRQGMKIRIFLGCEE